MVKLPWDLPHQIEINALLDRVQDLRRWQKEFYRSRTRRALTRCKALERDVDAALDSLSGNLWGLIRGDELTMANDELAACDPGAPS